MSPDVVLVDLAGFAMIAWIVWYFFLSRRALEGAATVAAGVQEIQVVVKGGYIPEVIRAAPGIPLRIHFRREETTPCSEEVVFPDFGVRRALPAFETTVIDLPAAEPKRYGFACGMDMMHGTLVVGDVTGPEPRPTAHEAAAAAMRDDWPVDPICGMKVDPERPAATSVRDGVTYYFCAVGCRDRFEGLPKPPSVQGGIQLSVRPRRGAPPSSHER